MSEEQTQSQFIFWVKEAGVFRPAELKMPENTTTYGLEKNIELREQDIPLDSLNLLSSVYLGDINIFKGQLEGYASKDVFKEFKSHVYGTVSNIVKLAEGVAKEQGAPYFAVNVVQTPKDRTWKFERNRDLLKYVAAINFTSIVKPFNEPKGPSEFVLCPTAQLYVSK